MALEYFAKRDSRSKHFLEAPDCLLSEEESLASSDTDARSCDVVRVPSSLGPRPSRHKAACASIDEFFARRDRRKNKITALEPAEFARIIGEINAEAPGADNDDDRDDSVRSGVESHQPYLSLSPGTVPTFGFAAADDEWRDFERPDKPKDYSGLRLGLLRPCDGWDVDSDEEPSPPPSERQDSSRPWKMLKTDAPSYQPPQLRGRRKPDIHSTDAFPALRGNKRRLC